MRSEFLARASWLNEERVTVYACIFVCLYVLIAIVWIGLSPGLIDPQGKPLGADFMTVWAAGKLALAGEPAAAYDYARHFEVQRQALPWTSDQTAPYFGWHYPPFFMLVAAVLALVPYGAALAAWTAATLPVYLAAIRAIVPYRRWLLFALAFPAVFVNLANGQSGFLTAGLLGLGLVLLETRPILSGVLFGLLAYKPQLGLLLPLALIVDRRWHAFTAAALTTVGASLLSYVVLGAETWRAFVSSVTLTRSFVLEQGAMGWEKLQSAFAAMRMLGADIETAYAVQASVSLCAAAAVIWVWRRPVAMPLKNAALVIGTLLATPYVMDYDLTLLALPIAWLAVEGLRTQFLDWEKTVLLGTWLLPIVSRQIGSFGVPIAPIALLLLLVFIIRRTSTDQISRQHRPMQPA
jgi:alpha-1,2-mannosyltransferase